MLMLMWLQVSKCHDARCYAMWYVDLRINIKQASASASTAKSTSKNADTSYVAIAGCALGLNIAYLTYDIMWCQIYYFRIWSDACRHVLTIACLLYDVLWYDVQVRVLMKQYTHTCVRAYRWGFIQERIMQKPYGLIMSHVNSIVYHMHEASHIHTTLCYTSCRSLFYVCVCVCVCVIMRRDYAHAAMCRSGGCGGVFHRLRVPGEWDPRVPSCWRPVLMYVVPLHVYI